MTFTIDELLQETPDVIESFTRCFYLMGSDDNSLGLGMGEMVNFGRNKKKKGQSRQRHDRVSVSTPEGYDGPGSEQRIEDMRQFYAAATSLLGDQADETPLEGVEDGMSYWD